MGTEASRPGRLTVGVVGAGRVGAVLGNALRSLGHSVVGASGASGASLERIATLLPGVPVLEVADVVAHAEVVLLTVPDDELPTLVRDLAARGAWRPGQIVVHTAGRFGVGVLAPAREAGVIGMAIHPAMTFSGTSLDLARLTGCPFAVTAPPAVLPIAQALAVELGGEPVVLPEEAREAYHAALAHGANHLVTLLGQAQRVLRAVGVEEPARLLGPLAAAALDGALRAGDAALTGPVLRGDSGTVAEHLRTLGGLAAADESLVDVPAAYTALARATVQRALARGGITPRQAEALLDALGEPGTSPAAAQAELGLTGAGAPPVVRTRGDLAAALAGLPGRRAVVMTMGALHEGHLELVRQARRHGDHVVVTIFVNPLQFAAGEDLDRYPRTLDADVAALGGVGADLVFAPEPDVVYPDGEPLVRLSAGPLGAMWEGAVRPGHFDGVLTVVAKLMNLLRPDVALFGQKDAQQLALIRRMVRDLDLPVEVVSVPTVRAADGLALSSRNAYLTAPQRRTALALHRSLQAARRAAERDGAGPEGVLAAARSELEAANAAEPGALTLDYVTLINPDSLEGLESDYRGTALLAVAARVGGTRLIDNTLIDLGVRTNTYPAGDG